MVATKPLLVNISGKELDAACLQRYDCGVQEVYTRQRVIGVE
jgi:hypothetical protein